MKNRKAFEQQLDQLQQDAMLLENALLIFIDIANLKTINDTYGMQIGDEAVIRTARSIQAAEVPHVSSIQNVSVLLVMSLQLW